MERYGKIPIKLFEAGIVDKKFFGKMQKMIGFRKGYQ